MIIKYYLSLTHVLFCLNDVIVQFCKYLQVYFGFNGFLKSTLLIYV